MGTNQLFGSASPLVAVTAANAVSNDLVLFPSYNRSLRVSVCEVLVGAKATIYAAAEATISTPRVFPVFQWNGLALVDSSASSLNPCVVAIKEADSLWKAQPLAAFVSVGTGLFDQKDAQSNESLKKLIEPSEVAEKVFKTLGLGCRLNVKFDRYFEIDSTSSCDAIMRETTEFLNKNPGLVRPACDGLLKALLFVSDVTMKKRDLEFTIKSRVRLPEKLASLTKNRDRYRFQLQNAEGKSIESIKFEFVETTDSMNGDPLKIHMVRILRGQQDFSKCKLVVASNLSVSDLIPAFLPLSGSPFPIQATLVLNCASMFYFRLK
jgi:hypothetical protein